METLWGTLDVLPVAAVPVELLDPIWNVSEALVQSAQEYWSSHSAHALP